MTDILTLGDIKNQGFLQAIALEIIRKAFEGKQDKSGKPYIDHLIRVADNFNEITEPDKRISALLHDLLEDCPHWTREALSNIFGDTIATTVWALTKQSNQSYEDYIERVSHYPIALEIKLKDLEDNMDVRRLPELTDKDIERLKKYHSAYIKLTTPKGDAIYP